MKGVRHGAGRLPNAYRRPCSSSGHYNRRSLIHRGTPDRSEPTLSSQSWQPVKITIRADLATLTSHNTPVAVSWSTPTMTAIWTEISEHFHYLNGHSKVPRLRLPLWPRPMQPVAIDNTMNGTTQPQLTRGPLHSPLNSNHWPLQFGRSGLRPSLVQGLRPRNAPLGLPTVLALPHHRGMPTLPPNQTGGCRPSTPSESRTGGEDKGLVKTDTVCGLVATI